MKRKEKPAPKWPAHPELSKVMTVSEVSAYLKVHPATIYRLLKKKKIPAFRLGRDWRFNIEAINRWLKKEK